MYRLRQRMISFWTCPPWYAFRRKPGCVCRGSCGRRRSRRELCSSVAVAVPLKALTDGLARRGWNRCSPAPQVRVGVRLVFEPLRIVTGCDQQRGGCIGSNALHGDQLRRDFAHQPIYLLIELGDLFGEVLV